MRHPDAGSGDRTVAHLIVSVARRKTRCAGAGRIGLPALQLWGG